MNLTGNVFLDIETDYNVGEQIEGNLQLSLKQGELVPSSTKILINNSGEVSEYILGDLVSENSTDGNFYVEGSSISGSGEGYGILGEKLIYPEVSFKLQLVSGENSESIEDSDDENLEKVDEGSQEVDEKKIVKEAEETKEIQKIEKEKTENVEEEIEEVKEEELEEIAHASVPSEEGEEVEASLVTGNAIAETQIEVNDLGKKIPVIKGKVSAENPYSYTLNEGESVSLVLGSVKVKGEKISDSEIQVSVDGNEVVVTTEYSETIEGFGEDYLTDETNSIMIDLSQLNLTAQEGWLTIKLSYDNLELISTDKFIRINKENKTIVVENITNITTSNITYEKIKDDPRYNAIIDSADNSTGDLVVVFHHDFPNLLPTFIKGKINYTLDKNISSAGENVTLTIPNWNNERFRILVGEETEAFEFGKARKITISADVKDSKEKKVNATIELIDSLTKESKFVKTKEEAEELIEEGDYNIKIHPEKHPVKEIEFKDIEVYDNIIELVSIDDVPETGELARYIEVYAIDPTQFNFTSATVTVTAKGTVLYKCKEWNFTEQRCYGAWVFLQSIIPGENYTFTLTPDDPGFAEYNSTFGAPYCGDLGESPCIANSSLLQCSDNQPSPGPEPNQPNTIDTCADSTTAGNCHSDESVENITITDLNGTTFKVGDTIQVNYTLWCWGTADRGALYYTNSTSSVSWRRITSGNPVCSAGGIAEVFTDTFVLDNVVGTHAVRAINKYNSDIASVCDGASYTDYDDVVFYVSTLDVTPPSIYFTYPTPANDTTTTNTSIKINVSITEANLDEVKFNWNGTNYTIYDNSLVLALNLNNNSAIGEDSILAIDISEHENNCGCSGTNCPSWTSSGRFGYASDFDGTDDYLNCGTNSSLNSTEIITIEAWVKFTGEGNSLQNMVTNGHAQRSLRLTGPGHWNGANKVLFHMMIGGTEHQLYSTSNLAVDTWHHIGGTYDGSEMRLYINGILNNNNSASGNIISAIISNVVGAESQWGYFFNGTIDEVRIWNKSLSASEIQQLYFMNLDKRDINNWALYVNQSKNSTEGLGYGTYTYQAFAKATSNYWNQTETRTLRIDPAPEVTLNLPEDNANLSSVPITFNCSATDNSNLSNITLYGNWTNQLFSDDFSSYAEGSNASENWDFENYGGSQIVENGTYHFSGATAADEPISIKKNFNYTDYTVEVMVKTTSLTGGAYICPRYDTIADKFEVVLDMQYSNVMLSVNVNNVWTNLNTTSLGWTIQNDTWYSLKAKITTEGTTNRFLIYVNDILYINQTNESLMNNGKLAILSYDWNDPYDIYFDNITVSGAYWSANETKNLTGTDNSTTFSVSMSYGTYKWNCLGYDTGSLNDWADSNRTLTIETINASVTPTPEINSSFGTNTTEQNLNCFDTLSNPNGDSMNVTVRWYKNGGLNLTIDYNNSYANATLFNAILGSGNTSKAENWSCSLRLYDGANYSDWGNSSNLTILNTLPTVTLDSPADNNVTIDRTPEFKWNNGTDADGDSLTYDLNLTCYPACSVDNRLYESISELNKTLTDYLKYLKDNGDYYNWTVRAKDDEGQGAWATPRKMEIQSSIEISMPNSVISFGSLTANGTNDTADDNPLPFLFQNDGNCMLNISINATDLWTSASNPSDYFKYKIDNKSGEEGSFNWQQSETSWGQMLSITGMAIVELNWSDTMDCAEIDLNVTTPPQEGAGNKESTVYFTASLGE